MRYGMCAVNSTSFLALYGKNAAIAGQGAYKLIAPRSFWRLEFHLTVVTLWSFNENRQATGSRASGLKVFTLFCSIQKSYIFLFNWWPSILFWLTFFVVFSSTHGWELRNRSRPPHTFCMKILECKTWGIHGGDYEEWPLLGCYAVWLLQEPTFRRNLQPPSMWQKSAN
jgi:hypothetical protein